MSDATTPTMQTGDIGKAHLRSGDDVLLRVEDLVVDYRIDRSTSFRAVKGISFDVIEGETLGLVGESGCGKSTTAKAIVQLPKPTAGTISFDGTELTALDDQELRSLRSAIQMIFQDPIAALNPRRTVRRIVSEGLVVANASVSVIAWAVVVIGILACIASIIAGSWLVAALGLVALAAGIGWVVRGIASPTIGDFSGSRVDEIITAVGLDADEAARRRPHEYSGGQCQRVAVARALVLDPKILICDEPVSALDVSVQAQILNMLEDMKERYGLTLVFISHDLSVVRNVSDRIAVMWNGRIVELGDSDFVFLEPAHAYTRTLLAALPDPTNPHADAAPDGDTGPRPDQCRINEAAGSEVCTAENPLLEQVGDRDHFVACRFHDQTEVGLIAD